MDLFDGIKEKSIIRKNNKKEVNEGCLDIWIDEFSPCLIDSRTGEIKETIAYKITDRKELVKFKEKNGWHINWNEIPMNVEVYALALKNDNKIQGLVGVRNDNDAEAGYIHWACASPNNNKHDFGVQDYIGVGGHLIAIAIKKSIEWGYNGVVHGFAANMDLVRHYEKVFNAEHIGMLHPYQIVIGELDAKKIMEVYDYEWNK